MRRNPAEFENEIDASSSFVFSLVVVVAVASVNPRNDASPPSAILRKVFLPFNFLTVSFFFLFYPLVFELNDFLGYVIYALAVAYHDHAIPHHPQRSP